MLYSIFIYLKKSILNFFLLSALICLVVFSETNYIYAQDALIIWATKVVPSLLPFFILVELIKHTEIPNFVGKILSPLMRPLFNVPNNGGFVLTMGMLSGYPMGAKLTAELFSEKKCTLDEAERLLAFTNMSGPLFVIGTCGIGMFESSLIGQKLLLAHILGALTVGILFRKHRSHSNSNVILPQNMEEINTSSKLNAKNFGKILGNAIQNSFSTLFLIGGYIILFSVLTNIITNIGIFKNINPYISSTICGILEVTNGIKEVSSLGTSSFTLLLSSFFLGFGGISILMQTLSIISSSGLSIKTYFFGKILHGIFSALYIFFFI